VGLIILLNVISFVYFLYRFLLTVVGLKSLKNINENKSPKDLPKYAIFLPCRNEKIGVIKKLIENIDNINYPKDKLDVMLLIDQDDDYLEEALNLELPNHFRIISASVGFPFTKPKVTNLGLALTDAKYGVIYDSEDRPDRNQLMDVVSEFNQDSDLVCVQCRLHYTNKKNNLLTRFFNLEYLNWFGLTIHGLSKAQLSDYPVIPLGGTSNHYDLEVLKSMGGHDAYNITEDAALGVHFALENKKIKTINSVTEELAVDELWTWIKQRTRWNLGHLITYVVFSRNFNENFKKLGAVRYLNLVLVLLGNFIVPFITPLLFTIFILDFFGYGAGETFIKNLPYITLIGNYLLIVISHALASIMLQRGKNLILCLLQPFYYLLHSVASWRALYKFFTAPTVWEKTNHKESAEFE
jgi:cellulose synthase/poly-beta-1,6-N-acetylglucosamine synthase-like glycosyltransferase